MEAGIEERIEERMDEGRRAWRRDEDALRRKREYRG